MINIIRLIMKCIFMINIFGDTKFDDISVKLVKV
jgi:hypothetical protein